MAINEQFIEPRYEIIDGETIMMSPRPTLNHNRVITNLAVVFDKYLDGKKCEYFTDGVDVHFDEKNRVIPDSMIVCNTDILKPNGIYGTPDLIVEVLSPSTARKDKGDKKTLYEKHGVKEYWIIDPVAKSIEVYLLKDDRYELDNVYTVIPDWDWEQMTEEEKKEAVLTFKVSLYDDFIIDIKDIFKNMVIY
ncbi:Uma2 family endonuclease [Metasolibacillus meyeri]|uniref:Uma2 family endonuclease n=1 Tax=Metasolibacillus meyeri TaxID=1071052 RepID=UPI00187D53FC|nr:Uma2 family endonuclease [Metasolibacillus meyeri]